MKDWAVGLVASAVLMLPTPGLCREFVVGAGMTTLARERVMLGGDLPRHETTTLAEVLVRGEVVERVHFEGVWLFAGALRNYQALETAGRVRSRANAAGAWLDVRLLREGPWRVYSGLGWKYATFRERLEPGTARLSTRSIERSVALRVRGSAQCGNRMELGAWWANGWTYGTGDDERVPSRYEWQGLSWSAGLQLGLRIFG